MSSGLYSHTTRGVGTVLTAAIYNADHVNHVTNHNPSQMGGYSDSVAEMQNAVNPGGLGTEQLATSLAEELSHLRFVIARLMGTTHWYEAPVTSLATIGGGIPLSLAFAATPLTLRRTENDTTAREYESVQSGSGVGNKYSKTLVGTGSNAVAELRELIGATELLRKTLTLITHQIATHINGALSVGAAGVGLTRIDPTGFQDIAVSATPANPAASHLRLYIKNDGGVPKLAALTPAGVEVLLEEPPAPILSWEQIDDSGSISSEASIEFTFTTNRYAKIIIVISDVVPSSSGATLIATLRHSGGAIITLTGAGSATDPRTYNAEFTIGLVAGTKRHFGVMDGNYGGAIETEPIRAGASSASTPDRVRVAFSAGNINSGRIMAYGLLATT